VSIRYSSPEIQKKEKTFDEEEGELQKKKRRKIAKEEEEYLTFEPFLLLMKKKDYCMTNQSICPSRKVEALKQVEEKINLTKEYQSNYKCNLSTKLWKKGINLLSSKKEEDENEYEQGGENISRSKEKDECEEGCGKKVWNEYEL